VGRVTTDAFGTSRSALSVPWSLTSGQWQMWVLDPVYSRIISIILRGWETGPSTVTTPSLSGYDTFEFLLSPTSVSGLSNCGPSTRIRLPSGRWSRPSPTGSSHEGFNEKRQMATSTPSDDRRQDHPSGPSGSTLSSSGPAPAITKRRRVPREPFGVSAGRVSAMKPRRRPHFGIDTLAMRADQRSSAPVVVGTSVYVGTREATSWPLKTSTGATEWSFATERPSMPPPRSRAASSTWRRRTGICGLSNATTGKKVWVALGAEGDGSAAVVGGVVYSGFVNDTWRR